MLKLIIWRATQFIMDFSMEVPLISLHFSILLTLFIIRLISIGGLYLLGVQLLASVCCVCYAVITTAIIIFLLSLCIRFRSLFTSIRFRSLFTSPLSDFYNISLNQSKTNDKEYFLFSETK